MQEPLRKHRQSGQVLYSRPFLPVYDAVALGLFCRFVWGCASQQVLELYNQHVSANHLDVGVGTGYFLDRCRFPVANPRLVLLDLNPNSLDKAARRLARYHPRTYRGNILAPVEVAPPGFDSVGLTHVLHCIPGAAEAKAVVLEHVEAVLNPGGVLFGSTLLFRGMKMGLAAKLFMSLTNALGLMSNREDDLEGLKHNLESRFPESCVTLVGYDALFWARKAG
ncbi:MAG: methyltransferase type 12 [Chloroflexi bacterium]|nr:MAG: methyltransferase type 12 [Chloroflexota bacterium]RLC97064.1 MAG: methyltransferase type 12 [Chloroflexota bacterium]